MGGNKALQVNRFVVNNRTVDIHITTRGSDWYYAVMSFAGFVMLLIIGGSFLKPASKRIFYYIFALINFVVMIEHYSMASNLGWVPIDVEWQRSAGIVAGRNRQIWWVRYCGWFLTWPLLSLAVLLSTATPTMHIIWTCFLSASMAVLALVGAMVKSDFKWGYYGFWVWSWLLIGYSMLWAPRRYAAALGRDVRISHFISSSWIWFLWMTYPVCWGLCEGGNVLSPDSEFIWYGIVDCCLVPITSLVFLGLQWTIDPQRLGLNMRSYDEPLWQRHEYALASGALPIKEKGANTNGAHSATNPQATGENTVPA